MRIISISTDRNVCDTDSEVAKRQRAYGNCFDRTDIILFSHRSHACEAQDLGNNVFVHPTNSRSRVLYGWDALRIAGQLGKPDVVTTQDPFESGVVGVFLSWFTKAALYVQLHTDIYAKDFVRAHHIMNRMRCAIAPFVLKQATRVRMVSERAKESLEKRIGTRKPVSVLPIFVDIQKFATLTRTKHPRWKIALLYVGRLEEEKRSKKVLEILVALRSGGHDAGATIVGEGSERKSLETYARKMNIQERVQFVGWQRDPSEYIAQSDLVVVPSQYEGYGMVIIEALAAGVPVLATDVGIAREAGAMVVPYEEFEQAALAWATNGPHQGTLAAYPYDSFDDYVQQYCEDIRACHN